MAKLYGGDFKDIINDIINNTIHPYGIFRIDKNQDINIETKGRSGENVDDFIEAITNIKGYQHRFGLIYLNSQWVLVYWMPDGARCTEKMVYQDAFPTFAEQLKDVLGKVIHIKTLEDLEQQLVTATQ